MKKKKRIKVAYLAYDHMRQLEREERLRLQGRIHVPGQRRGSHRIFSGKDRERAVAEVAAVLRSGKSSAFENEGAVRHGVRSTLCLDGHRWPIADLEAEKLLETAFAAIGAKRPSWEEGQREYVVPRDTCSWCGGAVPDEIQFGDHRIGFCSEECAKSARAHRDRGVRSTYDKGYRAAQAAIARLRNPIKACKHCGTKFRPHFDHNEYCSHACSVEHRTRPDIACAHCGTAFRPKTDDTKYCSQTCAGLAERTVPDQHCIECGTPFRVSQFAIDKGKGKFCGSACYIANRSRRRVTCTCVYCLGEFETGFQGGKYCSTRCQSAFEREARGHPPRRLKPHIFDRYIQSAVPRQLTASMFDVLTS